MVVGGGDSALQEGLFLTKFANRVRVVHRRDQFRAGPALQERMHKNEKMLPVWNSVIKEIRGNGAVEQIVLEDTQTGALKEEDVSGVFVYIGHEPNTELFKGQLEMDHEGYLTVDWKLHTNITGWFETGQVHEKWLGQ